MSGGRECKEGGKKYREYVVAALLHDIGKLIRRARLCRGERAERHTKESVHFVELIKNALRAAGLDVDLIKQLIARHHEDGGIAPYDRAAALERRAHGDEESREGLAIAERREEDIPLAVYVDGRALYVPPCPLPASLEEAERLVPQELPPRNVVCECYVRSYERLLRLAAALNARVMSYQQLVETLLYVLRSTTTFVPAAVYGVSVPDTSLYAHSLLSAALASTGGEFVLVALDVGKIQDYMKRARVTKGAMALLRGRSLMVSLLQRIAVRWLIDAVNKSLGADVVTWANVLLDTGGEVLLILPHVERLDELLEQLERRALEDTSGALALYAARVGPCRLKDLEEFGSLVRELERAMHERKMRYVEYSAWSGGEPNARSQRGRYAFYSDTCEFCGRPARTAERQVRDARFELCDECWREYEAGRAARNLQALVIAREGPHAGKAALVSAHGCEIAQFSFLGYTVFVAGGKGCSPDAVAGTAAQLMRDSDPVVYFANRPADFIRGHDGVGYGFVFTNQYLPREDEGVMSLESVGPCAVFIKADANEMGRRKYAASKRPSLLVTFSTAVSAAYELYPALLASERQRENIFVIYAGGDDLTLAGDLSALKYIARVVKYAERWGFRTAVGVKIDEPYLPVYYAWTETDLRLKRAKDYGRDKSIAVVITDPVEIAVDVAELGQIYDLAAPDEMAEEKLGRLARIVYLKLFEAYAQLAALKRGAAAQQRLAACRELARVFVELAYVLNRRVGEEGVGEFLGWLKSVSGLDLTPDKLPGVYEMACGRHSGAGASGVEEMLRRAILGLYLAFLKRKAERAESS
jgi:CRISPR-associated protein Csm1